MQKSHPYAPINPAPAAAPPDAGGAIWREGPLLVCRQDAAFPARCVKCNHAAVPPLRRYKLSWYSSGPLNILLYVIVGAVAIRRAEIKVGLCERHQRQRRLGWQIGWGGFAALLVTVVLGARLEIGELAAIAMLAAPLWVILLVELLSLPQLVPAHIDKETIRVKGCGRAFLDSLPGYAGRRRT